MCFVDARPCWCPGPALHPAGAHLNAAELDCARYLACLQSSKLSDDIDHAGPFRPLHWYLGYLGWQCSLFGIVPDAERTAIGCRQRKCGQEGGGEGAGPQPPTQAASQSKDSASHSSRQRKVKFRSHWRIMVADSRLSEFTFNDQSHLLVFPRAVN